MTRADSDLNASRHPEGPEPDRDGLPLVDQPDAPPDNPVDPGVMALLRANGNAPNHYPARSRRTPRLPTAGDRPERGQLLTPPSTRPSRASAPPSRCAAPSPDPS